MHDNNERIAANIPEGTKTAIHMEGARQGEPMAQIVRETLIEKFGYGPGREEPEPEDATS